MHGEEELTKLIQTSALSKALESIERLNKTLERESVISFSTPETTLKTIKSIQKSIDSFKFENI